MFGLRLRLNGKQKTQWFAVVGAVVVLSAFVMAALPSGTFSARKVQKVTRKSQSAATVSAAPADRPWQKYEKMVARNPFRPLVTKNNGNGSRGLLSGVNGPGALPPLGVSVVPASLDGKPAAQNIGGWAFVGTVGMNGRLYALLENRSQNQGGYYCAGDMSPIGRIEAVTTQFVRVTTPQGIQSLPLVSGDTIPGGGANRPGRQRQEAQQAQDDEVLRALEAVAAALGTPAEDSGTAQPVVVNVGGSGGRPRFFPGGPPGFMPGGSPGMRGPRNFRGQ
ncbi:MAG: hypothetical protein ACUVRO_04645 [Armatimonadota bacterium]